MYHKKIQYIVGSTEGNFTALGYNYVRQCKAVLMKWLVMVFVFIVVNNCACSLSLFVCSDICCVCDPNGARLCMVSAGWIEKTAVVP